MQAGFAQQQMFNPVQGQGGVQSNQYAQPGASGQPSVPYNGNHMVNYPPPQQQQQPFLQGNQGHCQPQGFYHAGGGGYQQPTPATPHNYVNQDYQQMPVLQQPGTTATPQQPGATATSQQPDPTATPQQPDATTPQSTGTKTEDKDHTGFRVALSSLFSNQNKSEREAAATKQNQKATPETTEQGQKTVPASTEQGQKTVPASTEQGLKTVPASTGQGLETVPASTGQGLETVPASTGQGPGHSPAQTPPIMPLSAYTAVPQQPGLQSLMPPHLSAHGQHATPYGQSAPVTGQHATPYGQPATPYGQPATPYGQPATPYGQPATPYGQPAPVTGQHAAPVPGQPAAPVPGQPAAPVPGQPAAPAAPVPGQPAAPAAPVPGQPAAPVHGPQMAGKPELIRIWQSTHNQIGTMENRLKSLNHSMGQIELAIEQSSMLAPPTTPLHQGSTPGSDSERNRAELQNVMQAINVDKARRHDQGQT